MLVHLSTARAVIISSSAEEIGGFFCQYDGNKVAKSERYAWEIVTFDFGNYSYSHYSDVIAFLPKKDFILFFYRFRN